MEISVSRGILDTYELLLFYDCWFLWIISIATPRVDRDSHVIQFFGDNALLDMVKGGAYWREEEMGRLVGGGGEFFCQQK